MSRRKRVEQYDVCVVGGGVAGVSAAVAAARRGAKVALVERSSTLGGIASQAWVGTICGLYHMGDSSGVKAGHFANECVQRLDRRTPHKAIMTSNGLAFLPCMPWEMELLCFELLEESRVEIFLHSACFETRCAVAALESVTVLVGNTTTEFPATAYIDATGEGILSLFSNAEMIDSHEYQAPGFVFSVSGVNSNLSERELSLQALQTLLSATADGLLESCYSRVTVVPGSLRGDEVLLKLGFPNCRLSTFNEHSALEQFGRNAASECLATLRNGMPEFAAARLSSFAPTVGIRSGKRGLGKSLLTEENLLNGASTQYPVARGLWPLEFWKDNRKPSMSYFSPHLYYDIDAFHVWSRTYDNLFQCGRGISADEHAVSSARVIGTCFSTGFAAGSLASEYVANSREPVERLADKVSSLLQKTQYGGL